MIKTGDLVLKDQKYIWLILYVYKNGNEYMLKFLHENSVNTLHIMSLKNLKDYKDLRVINV